MAQPQRKPRVVQHVIMVLVNAICSSRWMKQSMKQVQHTQMEAMCVEMVGWGDVLYPL